MISSNGSADTLTFPGCMNILRQPSYSILCIVIRGCPVLLEDLVCSGGYYGKGGTDGTALGVLVSDSVFECAAAVLRVTEPEFLCGPNGRALDEPVF